MTCNEGPRLASRKLNAYYGRLILKADEMQDPFATLRAGYCSPIKNRRGITVLGLLLLIIAVIIVAILLTRYLRNRPAAALRMPAPVIAYSALSHQPLDQLNLTGVI
jgi:hypothetical protein